MERESEGKGNGRGRMKGVPLGSRLLPGAEGMDWCTDWCFMGRTFPLPPSWQMSWTDYRIICGYHRASFFGVISWW